MSNSLGKTATLLFVAQATVAFINLPATLLLANSLGPEGLGSYQFLSRLALMVISVGQLGYPHALSWAVTNSPSTNGSRIAFRSGVVVASVVGVTTCLGLLLYGAIIWPDSRYIWYGILAAYPAVNLLASNIANTYRGLLDVRRFSIIRISQPVVYLLAISTFYVIDALTVTVAVAALLAAQTVSCAAGLVLSIRQGMLKRPELPVAGVWRQRAEIRSFARRVWPGLMVRDWNSYLDQLVVGVLLGPASLGIYAVAVSISASLSLLGSPLTNATQPIVQRETTLLGKQQAVGAILFASLAMLTLAALLLGISSPFLIGLLLGADFAAVVPLLAVMVVAAVSDNLNAAMHGVLVGLGAPGKSSRNVVVGLMVNILCWTILLPTMGITGAAVTSLLSYFSVSVLMVKDVSSMLGVRPRQLVVIAYRSRTTAWQTLTQLLQVRRQRG
ncbi:polysaccharide biosynthesis C-terminal domain-containing protein [Pseudonocardia sp. RS11V-5]|uniref:lipopolysaccharide biosynthesis protein n=1 Tax=Pseudonocardia terrae TaxID=2905831 RepID=UPI001E352BBC|nr:polysaccharide biosynthesis C-terminal domain-containing protein [Pseudonocardia terrae]MCE3556437.1 polysaccharide biosynthesis C-terminal domain-containing protein [Pseudonocardia terrae]